MPRELIKAVSRLEVGTLSTFCQQPLILCFLWNSTKSSSSVGLPHHAALVVVATAAEIVAEVGLIVQGNGAAATWAPVCDLVSIAQPTRPVVWVSGNVCPSLESLSFHVPWIMRERHKRLTVGTDRVCACVLNSNARWVPKSKVFIVFWVRDTWPRMSWELRSLIYSFSSCSLKGPVRVCLWWFCASDRMRITACKF